MSARMVDVHGRACTHEPGAREEKALLLSQREGSAAGTDRPLVISLCSIALLTDVRVKERTRTQTRISVCMYVETHAAPKEHTCEKAGCRRATRLICIALVHVEVTSHFVNMNSDL